MEIKVNVPTNDFVKTKEIRNEIVQGICDAFLSWNAWSTFHPRSNGVYRPKTNYIFRNSQDTKFVGFTGKRLETCINEKFNADELSAAVECLKKAGYYFHRVYSYGTWIGYECSRYPSIENGDRVENIIVTSDF